MITDFVFSNDNGILAASLDVGVYKSYDFDTWERVNVFDDKYWSMGKDMEGNIYAGSQRFINRSTDNGDSWIGSKNAGGRIENFVHTPDSNFFAGGMNKIFRKSKTIDNYWETIDFPDSIGDNYPVLLASDSLNNLYAYAANRVFLSTDHGNMWKYESLFWGEYQL